MNDNDFEKEIVAHQQKLEEQQVQHTHEIKLKQLEIKLKKASHAYTSDHVWGVAILTAFITAGLFGLVLAAVN